MMPTEGRTDHVEVTIDALFVEHYDPPKVPPKTSAAMKGRRRRVVPHPRSLVGIGLIGAALAGAGLLVFKRWFA
ncbi:MAG: hypothetical protein KIT84_02650 [Labilithrix sp.]|nr:hypothetical protein [Labilithrix sp.]MCW5809880.1 hypothetical protein [Labilithrix sp.]